MVGHLAAWNYFQSAESDLNSSFIKDWKATMGNKRVTTQSLKVVSVRHEENLILVKGSVPGANGSILLINKALKKK